jgi:predicted O-methyltransferase YrrM
LPTASSLRSPLNLLRRFLRKGTEHALPTHEELLEPLDPPFRAALLSMYRGEPQLGLDGERHAIDPLVKISPAQGLWLYKLCRSLKPKSTIEIGLCYGFSTLFFIAALAENRSGCHTAVDPNERSDWHGIGLAHVKSLGMEAAFCFIEDRSDCAATDLIRTNSAFDIIFIDGSHRFDDVLVDFYLYAPLCGLGGLIIFDDLWMKSIQSTVAFIRSNRNDFAEVTTPEQNIAVFRKVGADAREWDHFRPFAVARATGVHR